jgi:3-isopropylmalate/(R)-2-methylmalate dehydratase small subunit
LVIEGRVYRFGDDVDTDQIVPGRYLDLVKPEDIALHVMEGADAGFSARFVPGSVIVAGRNFGCGSSREHAPIGLRAAGVSCVVAESFGRIFYRNAISVGLPILRCDCVRGIVAEGDRVIVDLSAGTVSVPKKQVVLQGERLSDRVIRLLECGGLVNYVREQIRSGEG